jgi:hypothetical protein
MPPRTYKWSVTHSAGPAAFEVDAAYSVIEEGHMVLKDADHKPVFTAQPGMGCTFERKAGRGVYLAAVPAFKGLDARVAALEEAAKLAKPEPRTAAEVRVTGGAVMSDEDIAKLTERIGRSLKLRPGWNDTDGGAAVPATGI